MVIEFGFFGHWKRFDIFKAIASLDTYQITNYSDSKKKISFYEIFKKIEKVFSNKQFLDKNITLSIIWSIQNYAFRNTMVFIQIVQKVGG